MSSRVLTPEDALTLKVVSDAQISPGGDRVAFVVGDPNITDARKPRSALWTVPASGGEPAAFTRGPRTDKSPRWSPDGKSLAFLSDREEDGRFQVHLIPASGGEAVPLTSVKGDISDLAWSPDGGRIALLMTDPRTEAEEKREKERDDPLVADRDLKHTRLWMLDVANRRMTLVTPGGVHVHEFAWSPDGGKFALVACATPQSDAWFTAWLGVVPASGGPVEVVCRMYPRQVGTPAWSPDGGQIAFLSCTWSDAGIVGGDVYLVPASGGTPRCLTEGHPRNVTYMDWSPDGREILYVAHENGGSSVGRLSVADGGARTVTAERMVLAERGQPRFSLDRTRRAFAAAREDVTRPRDVWVGSFDGPWRRLSDVNPQLKGVALGEVEAITWKGTDGLDIPGLLFKPVGFEAGRRYPTVVQIHGGPASVWPWRFHAGWNDWAHLLVARGFAVLLPNPRGSFGWGVRFTEANLGDMGGLDYEDILAGVDHLVQAGIADPDRLGVGGWSYGGYMTAWAVTQTTRFRAAVMGAGISNWLSFHGTTDIPTWDALFYQTSPYEGTLQARRSPITHIRNARTPTLILHGQSDTCVPVSQAHEFYRGLREQGVEAELVVYPREGHPILERNHQRDLLSRVIGWFEKHLTAEKR